MPGSWDHLPKRFEPFHVDHLLVWAEVFKREAVELQGYGETVVTVVGIPQYDIFANKEFFLTREEFFSQFGLNPSCKIIAFFSGAVYAPDDGDIVGIIMRFIKEEVLEVPTELFLRAYPGADAREHRKFDTFQNEKRVYIDWIEPQKLFAHAGNRWYPTINSAVHLMNVMHHADVIVNTFSSVSVEASAFEKPIININFDGYQTRPFSQSIKRFKNLSHYKHILATDGVVMVNDEHELLRTLNLFLENPDANKKNVTILRDKMCWKIDGNASGRIAEKIMQALSKTT
jgi:hypothetical protein